MSQKPTDYFFSFQIAQWYLVISLFHQQAVEAFNKKLKFRQVELRSSSLDSKSGSFFRSLSNFSLGEVVVEVRASDGIALLSFVNLGFNLGNL